MSEREASPRVTRRAVVGSVAVGTVGAVAGCLGGGNRVAWEYDDPGDTHRVVGDAIHAYEPVRSLDASGTLRVVDASSGEQTETAALGPAWNVTADGERTYYAGNGRIVGRAADGSADWTERLIEEPSGSSVHGEVADLTAAGGTAYATRAGPLITVLDASSGDVIADRSTERWSDVGDLIANVLVASDAVGHLLVHIEDGRIYADDHQGAEQWVVETPWTSDERRNALLADGEHIAVICETELHVHDRSGEHLWSADVPDIGDALVALGTEHLYLYTNDSGVVANAIEDGSEAWTVDPDGVGAYGLAVAEDTVYCSTNATVHALSTEGDEQWSEDGAYGDLFLNEEYLYAADDRLVAIERE